jgi:UDP-N-acetylglucosamine 2-epimerase (non-hydrolysing)
MIKGTCRENPAMRASDGRRRIVSIVGTRPEAIKMAPLTRAIAARRDLRHEVILTGQHRGLSGMFEADVVKDLSCDPRGRTAPRLREALHRAIYPHLSASRADLVLVQGDTASAFAGALAARSCGVPIGHVEAGLRSFDLKQPWPEEGNRTAIDALAELLFAPTEAAAANLAADWRVKGRVFVTGNTGIDALLQARKPIAPPQAAAGERTILVTCHRKENQGGPIRTICTALRRIVREFPLRVVLPLHPNPHVRRELESLLGDEPRISLIEPLDHGEMVCLMDASWLILTDSGGLQEEGPALGKPVLVMRNVTERQEAVATDNIELVGTETAEIVRAVSRLLRDPDRYARMSRPAFPFGDGSASERILAAIDGWFSPRGAAPFSMRRGGAGRGDGRGRPAPPPDGRSGCLGRGNGR